MVRFVRIDPMTRGSNQSSAELSPRMNLVAISLEFQNVGITRCGHIKRKDKDTV